MSTTNPIDVTIQVSKQGTQSAYHISDNSGGSEVRGDGTWYGVNEDMTIKGSLLFTTMPEIGGYTVSSRGGLNTAGGGIIHFVLAAVGEKTATLTVTSTSPTPSETSTIVGEGDGWVIL